MTRRTAQAIGVRATVLSPFHYHSLAVPSGTATQPEYLTDRQMSFALAGTLGCLSSSPALPRKDYRGHLAALPFLASVFETRAPRLLPPRACRLNIDAETGFTWPSRRHQHGQPEDLLLRSGGAAWRGVRGSRVRCGSLRARCRGRRTSDARDHRAHRTAPRRAAAFGASSARCGSAECAHCGAIRP